MHTALPALPPPSLWFRVRGPRSPTPAILWGLARSLEVGGNEGGGCLDRIASMLSYPPWPIFWIIETICLIKSFVLQQMDVTVTETHRHPLCTHSYRTEGRAKGSVLPSIKFVFHKSRHIYLGQNRDIPATQKTMASF